MRQVYMLDTCICSFIMREQPLTVLHHLDNMVGQKHRIVISSITYAEMRLGSIGKKASPKHAVWVDEFITRVDAVLPWDKSAVDETIALRQYLSAKGIPIGANDAAIAGHALAAACVLVTNNLKEFRRVPRLPVEDWTTKT